MAKINKFILVPIGLPGMGKTTLSRFLSSCTSSGVIKVDHLNKLMNCENKTNLRLDFQKISYDRILTGNQKDYCEANPSVGMHEAIDIIRGKADQDYLD